MNSIHRKTAWLGFLTAGVASLAVACGDGGTTGTAGSAGTEATGATGGSAGTAGTGGTATGGSGGTSMSGGSGGSGGMSMALVDGSPCTMDAECANGFCISQTMFGWPYGYCSGACNSVIPCGDPKSACVQLNNQPFCLKQCATNEDCGKGQACSDTGDGSGTMVCIPHCTTDKECEGYGVCDTVNGGFCVIPEDCAMMGDEDGNGYADCEDAVCAMSCKPQFDSACMMAEGVTVVAGMDTVLMGDNSNGTEIFVGSCSGQGNRENIYKVTGPANQDGVVHVTLTSAEDLILYARSDCATSGAELGCSDSQSGGSDETLDVNVAKGASVYVFVDGTSFFGSTGNQGPYTLTMSFEQQVCGDGKIIGTEQCDDGNTMAGDGCNATCAAEPKAEVEPNNDKMTATGVGAAGVLYKGKLQPGATDEDWYMVNLVGKTSITATTLAQGADTCAPMGQIDTHVYIYNAVDAMAIADSEDINGSTDPAVGNWCSSAVAQGLADGIYYVQVTHTTYCNPMMAGDCKDFDYGVLIQQK